MLPGCLPAEIFHVYEVDTCRAAVTNHTIDRLKAMNGDTGSDKALDAQRYHVASTGETPPEGIILNDNSQSITKSKYPRSILDSRFLSALQRSLPLQSQTLLNPLQLLSNLKTIPVTLTLRPIMPRRTLQIMHRLQTINLLSFRGLRVEFRIPQSLETTKRIQQVQHA